MRAIVNLLRRHREPGPCEPEAVDQAAMESHVCERIDSADRVLVDRLQKLQRRLKDSKEDAARSDGN